MWTFILIAIGVVVFLCILVAIFSKSKPFFSKDYYDTLKWWYKELRKILNRLNKKPEFVEIAKQHTDYIVLYDMLTIFNVLYKGDTSDRTLEKLGLTMTVPSNSLINQYTYKQAKEAYEQNLFDSAIDKTVALEISNPLVVSGTDVEVEVLPTEKLAMPLLLNYLDSKEFDKYAALMYQFGVIMAKSDGTETQDEKNKLELIYSLTHTSYQPETKSKQSSTNARQSQLNLSESESIPKTLQNDIAEPVSKTETLEDVLAELNSMIGLGAVKNEISSLINFLKVQKQREDAGLPTDSISYHLVFTGNPGTGKTTVARIISRLYKQLGILERGHLVETDRADLIAEYVGQTAVKVDKVIDTALDGILFIDEAYSLDSGGSDVDYGKEAVATILKRMEDDRNRLILIVAGYKTEMKSFIEMNPGLGSRFNRFIEFADYTAVELYQIFEAKCNKSEYVLTSDAVLEAQNVFKIACQHKDKTFGNGRFVRNFYEKVIEKQSNRIAKLQKIDKKILTTITTEDLV